MAITDRQPWFAQAVVCSQGRGPQQITVLLDYLNKHVQAQARLGSVSEQAALRLVGARLSDDCRLAPVADLLGREVQRQVFLEN